MELIAAACLLPFLSEALARLASVPTGQILRVRLPSATVFEGIDVRRSGATSWTRRWDKPVRALTLSSNDSPQLPSLIARITFDLVAVAPATGYRANARPEHTVEMRGRFLPHLLVVPVLVLGVLGSFETLWVGLVATVVILLTVLVSWLRARRAVVHALRDVLDALQRAGAVVEEAPVARSERGRAARPEVVSA